MVSILIKHQHATSLSSDVNAHINILLFSRTTDSCTVSQLLIWTKKCRVTSVSENVRGSTSCSSFPKILPLSLACSKAVPGAFGHHHGWQLAMPLLGFFFSFLKWKYKSFTKSYKDNIISSSDFWISNSSLWGTSSSVFLCQPTCGVEGQLTSFPCN